MSSRPAGIRQSLARWRGAGARLAVAAGLVAAQAAACASLRAPAAEEPLRSILRSHPGLHKVVKSAPRFRFQAVLGLVEERPGGRPVLVQTTFRAGAEYFYPASAVKLFAAVAALEWLAVPPGAMWLDVAPIDVAPIGVDTPLVDHPLFAGETLEDADPSNVSGDRTAGRITLRHEIRKLFLVSDNQAFNRLYELVQQDGLAASLARAGLPEARIVHRLSEPRTPEENRRVPRIDFLVGTGQDFHSRLERTSKPLPPAPSMRGLKVGRAYLDAEDRRIEEPLDFAEKNRISLTDLQRGLCMVVRPDVDCGGPGFTLREEDRALLLEAMSQLPRESKNPVYDPAEHPDEEVKFLLPGLRRVLPGERLRVYNKIGQAYGFTTENAWVVDTQSGRGFFLAATLYTNEDGVLNDDRYDYETVAFPFLADLGEAAARRLLAPGQPAGPGV